MPGKPSDSTRRSAVRGLARSVSVYTLARCASGVIRFFTVSLLVHAVSATTFGTLATLWMAMLVVHGLCDLGLGTAALRLAPECETAPERRSLFATMVSARAILALLVTSVIVAVHEPLARWLTGSPNNGRALLWLALTRPVGMVFEGLRDELRARGAMSEVSWLVFLSTALVQGLSVAFSIGLGMELEGLVWARNLGEVLAFVCALVLCWRFVRGRPSVAHLTQLFAFGWPFGVLYALGTLRGLDRPLIGALTSVEHVATYELAMRLVGPVGVFNIALATVLEPFVYGHSQSPETPRLVDAFTRGYVAVFATVAMALSLLGPEVVTLFAPEPYRGAIRVLPSLAFAATCEGLQRAAGIGADLAKRTRVWAVASLLTLAVGFSLALVLVPRIGIAGAGFAWVVANTVATVVVYRVARGVSGIVLPVGRSLLLLAAGAGLGTAAAWQPWPAPIRLVLLAAFAFAARHVMRARWADLNALF